MSYNLLTDDQKSKFADLFAVGKVEEVKEWQSAAFATKAKGKHIVVDVTDDQDESHAFECQFPSDVQSLHGMSAFRTFKVFLVEGFESR